jgi:hypothetical protein
MNLCHYQVAPLTTPAAVVAVESGSHHRRWHLDARAPSVRLKAIEEDEDEEKV